MTNEYGRKKQQPKKRRSTDTTPHNRRTEDYWHIDHKIPLPAVVLLVIQLGGGIWWFSNLNSKVESLHDNQNKTAFEIAGLKEKSAVELGSLKDRTTRIETLVEQIEGTLKHIDDGLRELDYKISDDKERRYKR